MTRGSGRRDWEPAAYVVSVVLAVVGGTLEAVGHGSVVVAGEGLIAAALLVIGAAVAGVWRKNRRMRAERRRDDGDLW